MGFALVAMSAVAACGSVDAQGWPCAEGRLTDAEGAAISDADVGIPELGLSAMTDARGAWHFALVLPGSWMVQASDGVQVASGSVRVPPDGIACGRLELSFRPSEDGVIVCSRAAHDLVDSELRRLCDRVWHDEASKDEELIRAVAERALDPAVSDRDAGAALSCMLPPGRRAAGIACIARALHDADRAARASWLFRSLAHRSLTQDEDAEEDVARALGPALSCGDAEVRGVALDLLADLETPLARESILAALADPSRWVRLVALGELDDHSWDDEWGPARRAALAARGREWAAAAAEAIASPDLDCESVEIDECRDEILERLTSDCRKAVRLLSDGDCEDEREAALILSDLLLLGPTPCSEEAGEMIAELTACGIATALPAVLAAASSRDAMRASAARTSFSMLAGYGDITADGLAADEDESPAETETSVDALQSSPE